MATVYDDTVHLPSVVGRECLPETPHQITTLRFEIEQFVRGLERVFGQSFAVVDCATGQTAPRCDHRSERRSLFAPGQPANKLPSAAGRKSSTSARPCSCWPCRCDDDHRTVRWSPLAMFVSETVEEEAEVAAAAREFGVDARQAVSMGQNANAVAPARRCRKPASPLPKKPLLAQSTTQLKLQLADLSSHLLSTFEEITLLHRLTEHLSISKSVTDICGLSVAWLSDVIPAKCVAIWLNTNAQDLAEHTLDRGRRAAARADRPRRLPASGRRVRQIHRSARAARRHRAARAQSRRHQLADLVLSARSAKSSRVPIREGNRLFGWLLGHQSHRRRRNHQQRSRVRHGRSLPDGQRGHDPRHPLRQHRALPRAIGILRQRRAGAHVRHRRQGPVHLRSQRSRGPAFGAPGPRSGLQQRSNSTRSTCPACCTTSARSASTTTCCASRAR